MPLASTPSPKSPLRDPSVAASLWRESFEKSDGGWTRVSSDSMAPSLRAGDWVWIEPLGGRLPKPGEILLWRGPVGLVLHRCLYVRKKASGIKVRTKGDAAWSVDALVPIASVLGRARRFRRGAREWVPLRTSALVALAASWMRLLMVMARNRLRAMWGKSRRARLAGFTLDVHPSPEVPWDLLAQWLTFESGPPPPCRLFIEIDPSLDHRDPFSIRNLKGISASLGSSAFVLKVSATTALQLRVARRADATGGPCPSALENALRVLLLYLARQARETLVLHGAAFAPHAGARALVATGASGSGKTTLCRLLADEGFAIAGDDLILIRRGEKGLEVWGTPFSGDGADLPKHPGPYPLAGWLVLEKASGHGAEPVSTATVGAVLAANEQRLPVADTPPAPSAIDLERARELAKSLPGWRLRFARRPGLRQTIESLLRSGGPEAGRVR